MTIYDACVVLVLFLLGIAIWRHSQVARQAFLAAKRHTKEQGVALLDQSVVLKSLRISFAPTYLVAIERRFDFEFSTLGDVRYKGSVLFIGQRLQRVRLQPFKMPGGVDEFTP